MRPSFVLILVAVTWVVWRNDSVVAKDVISTNSGEPKFELPTARRYLKGGSVVSNVEDATKSKVEERISVPSFLNVNHLKDLFQKNLVLVKARRIRIKAFLAENPVIKKELIVTAVLLSLIVAVPLIVKSFYRA